MYEQITEVVPCAAAAWDLLHDQGGGCGGCPHGGQRQGRGGHPPLLSGQFVTLLLYLLVPPPVAPGDLERFCLCSVCTHRSCNVQSLHLESLNSKP